MLYREEVTASEVFPYKQRRLKVRAKVEEGIDRRGMQEVIPRIYVKCVSDRQDLEHAREG